MSPRQYRITVRGRLTEGFGPTFEGLRLEYENGATVLAGVLEDPAALYGVLDRLRDFGLELVGVQEVHR